MLTNKEAEVLKLMREGFLYLDRVNLLCKDMNTRRTRRHVMDAIIASDYLTVEIVLGRKFINSAGLEALKEWEAAHERRE